MNLFQRILLILAALLLLVFAFDGATDYSGNKPLATFNFLAAVALVYLSIRTKPQ